MLQIPAHFFESPILIALTSLLIFTSAFLVSWRSAPRIRKIYITRGHMDHPGGRKTQDRSVPYGGGLSILLGFAFPVVSGITAAWVAFGEAPMLLAVHGPGIRSKAIAMLAILSGASLMLFMGRADDRRGLSPGLRLILQLIAAGVVVATGVRITLFLHNPTLQIGLTILWLVFITNATNFIDNMDGLMAGSSLVSALALGVIAAASGQLFVCAFALALAGAIAGILPFNTFPAKVYLGDEGSMFVGFLLACLATLLTYASNQEVDGIDPRPFIVPLLCLIVPVLDGCFVILTRALRGLAPWTPGRDHLSHSLVKQGHTVTSAVHRLWLVALMGAAGAIVLQNPNLLSMAAAVLFLSFAAFLHLRRQSQ